MASVKKLGLLSSTGLTVGAMIGAAIFSLSGLTIAQSGAWSIFAWVIAGVISLLFALVVAAFAAKWQDLDGGVYVYPKRVISKVYAKPTLGNVVGFLTMWVYVVGCFAGVVFSCSYFAKYLGIFFPDASPETSTLIAVVALLVMMLLNLGRISLTAYTNNVLVIILVGMMIVFAGYSFLSADFSFDNFSNQMSNDLFASITQSTPVAILAYGTIVLPAFLVGSIKNPKRNVPLTMLISMLIVVVIYVFQLIALNGTIPADFASHPESIYTPYFVSIGGNPLMLSVIGVGALIALFTTGLVLTRLLVTSLVQGLSDGQSIQTASKNETAVNKLEPNSTNTTDRSSNLVKLSTSLLILLLGAVVLVLGGEVFEIVQLGAVLNLIYISVICLCAFLMKEFSLRIRVLALTILLALILSSVASIGDGGLAQLIYSFGVILVGGAIYFAKMWYNDNRVD